MGPSHFIFFRRHISHARCDQPCVSMLELTCILLFLASSSMVVKECVKMINGAPATRLLLKQRVFTAFHSFITNMLFKSFIIAAFVATVQAITISTPVSDKNAYKLTPGIPHHMPASTAQLVGRFQSPLLYRHSPWWTSFRDCSESPRKTCT